ncbi:hypothetical protein [Phytohabitans rumicis]|uniref:Uncharacterized protein n=1 Tax=Phytohabitans rumicis TaxID=1076125 RepID=A0A6V8KY31_9ACTN|nr:hypothetical protein [Phytohabitans rumicis]GFJ87598.1 hypothetical protein Prum_012400 [Phytohabitans rumicis]
MKLFSRPIILAVAGVVTTTALAVVVNVWTDSWNWIALVALLGLVVTATVLAVMTGTTARPAKTTVIQSASKGGRISDGVIRAMREADVEEHATNEGVIRRSKIDADNATVRRTSDGGVIEGGTLEAS